MSLLKTTLMHGINLLTSPKRQSYVNKLLDNALNSEQDATLISELKQELLSETADSTLLKLLYDQTQLPAMHKGTVAEARTAYITASKLASLPISHDLKIIDAELKSTDNTEHPVVKYRRYIPKNLKAPYPTTIYYHGGGWVIGDIQTHDVFCQRLAVGAQCQVISVEYPMGPEVTFPAAHDSCNHSWKLLTNKAKGQELDIDFHRCGVGGDSAGGHISAVISGKALEKRWFVPKAQLLIYPAVSMSMETESMKRYGKGFGLSVDLMEWFTKQYLGNPPPKDEELLAYNKDIMPVKKTPPTLVVSGKIDPLLSDAKLYTEHLKKLNIEHEHLIYPGLIHNFINMTLFPSAKKAVDEVCSKWGALLLSRELS